MFYTFFCISIRFVYKVNVMFESFIPWGEKLAGTFFDGERQVNLPLKGKIEYNREGDDKFIRVTAQPTVSSKASFM